MTKSNFLLLWVFLHVKNCPNCASFDCFLKYKNLPKIWPLQNSQSWQHWSGSRQQKWLMKPNVRPSAAVDAVCNINLANLLHLFFRWCKNCVNKGKLAKVFGFDRLLLHFCLIIKYYLFFSNSLICYWVDTWQIRRTIFNSYVTYFTTSMICLIVKLQKWENGKLFCLSLGKL